MTWDQFVENVKIFWNQPVPIIGATIGSLFIFVITIISKTSIGKKSLNELKGLYEVLTLNITTALTKFDEKKKEVDETILKQNEYLKNQLALVNKKYDKLEKLLIEIANNIPNIKVKSVISNYLTNSDEKVEE